MRAPRSSDPEELTTLNDALQCSLLKSCLRSWYSGGHVAMTAWLYLAVDSPRSSVAAWSLASGSSDSGLSSGNCSAVDAAEAAAGYVGDSDDEWSSALVVVGCASPCAATAAANPCKGLQANVAGQAPHSCWTLPLSSTHGLLQYGIHSVAWHPVERSVSQSKKILLRGRTSIMVRSLSSPGEIRSKSGVSVARGGAFAFGEGAKLAPGHPASPALPPIF